MITYSSLFTFLVSVGILSGCASESLNDSPVGEDKSYGTIKKIDGSVVEEQKENTSDKCSTDVYLLGDCTYYELVCNSEVHKFKLVCRADDSFALWQTIPDPPPPIKL